MSITYDLYARWKTEKKFTSDRQALLALGVSHGAAVHWKAGRNADADVIERMAKDLGEDPAMWAALVMTEQSKGEAARAWKRIARQLGAAASIAVVALMVFPAPAKASRSENLNGNTPYALCEIMEGVDGLFDGNGRLAAAVLASRHRSRRQSVG